jgi:hypothetical protein
MTKTEANAIARYRYRRWNRLKRRGFSIDRIIDITAKNRVLPTRNRVDDEELEWLIGKDGQEYAWVSDDNGNHYAIRRNGRVAFGEYAGLTQKEMYAAKEKQREQITSPRILTKIPRECLNGKGQLCFKKSVDGVAYKIGPDPQGDTNPPGLGLFDSNFRTPVSEEEIKKTTSMVRNYVADNPIIVNRHGEDAIAILKDGRQKSQFETGTSSGLLDHGIRADYERTSMGVPSDIRVSQRPIYGTVGFGDSTATQYGTVEFVLKNSIKQRTTVTVGDSLMRRLAVTPSLCTDIQPYSLLRPEKSQNASEYANKYGYIEAQIHGAVTNNDIALVLVPASNPQSKQIKELCEELEIYCKVE